MSNVGRSVEQSVHIAAPPEVIWAALTDAGRLEQWYAPGCPSRRLRAGLR